MLPLNLSYDFMNLLLTRQSPIGNAVRGVLKLHRGSDPACSFQELPTLENAAYLIPAGTYRIAVTYSPRFKRPLPLVCDVIGAPDDPNRPRSGIRFHRGSKPEHSKGCILLSVADEQHLTTLLTNHPSTLTIV